MQKQFVLIAFIALFAYTTSTDGTIVSVVYSAPTACEDGEQFVNFKLTTSAALTGTITYKLTTGCSVNGTPDISGSIVTGTLTLGTEPCIFDEVISTSGSTVVKYLNDDESTIGNKIAYQKLEKPSTQETDKILDLTDAENEAAFLVLFKESLLDNIVLPKITIGDETATCKKHEDDKTVSCTFTKANVLDGKHTVSFLPHCETTPVDLFDIIVIKNELKIRSVAFTPDDECQTNLSEAAFVLTTSATNLETGSPEISLKVSSGCTVQASPTVSGNTVTGKVTLQGGDCIFEEVICTFSDTPSTVVEYLNDDLSTIGNKITLYPLIEEPSDPEDDKTLDFSTSSTSAAFKVKFLNSLPENSQLLPEITIGNKSTVCQRDTDPLYASCTFSKSDLGNGTYDVKFLPHCETEEVKWFKLTIKGISVDTSMDSMSFISLSSMSLLFALILF